MNQFRAWNNQFFSGVFKPRWNFIHRNPVFLKFNIIRCVWTPPICQVTLCLGRQKRLQFYILPCCRSILLALMESADSHLISNTSYLFNLIFRFRESLSDLFAIALCSLRNLETYPAFYYMTVNTQRLKKIKLALLTTGACEKSTSYTRVSIGHQYLKQQ